MHLSDHSLRQIDDAYLRSLDPEALCGLSVRLLVDLKAAHARLNQGPTNSSRPPSSRAPWERGETAAEPDEAAESLPMAAEPDEAPAAEAPPAAPAAVKPAPGVRKAGKQPGAPGVGRTQVFAAPCACGHHPRAEAGRGEVDPRLAGVELSEWRGVGPGLAGLIVARSLRFRRSRARIQEFLGEWLGVELSIGTIHQTLHEAAAALAPAEDELVDAVLASGLLHADETSWPERGQPRWLWVFTAATVTLYSVAGRGQERVENVLEGFTGGLMSDGWVSCRHDPRRLRCWAHLRRKAQGLVESYQRDVRAFGRQVRDALNALMAAVYAAREGPPADLPTQHARLLTELRAACERHQGHTHAKTHALAVELLNDGDAIFQVLHHPELPLTHNAAERALRHWVIARKRRAAEEAKPLHEQAQQKRQEATRWKERLEVLRIPDRQDRDWAAIEHAEQQMQRLTREARELTGKAEDLENAVYDLKAVNPHKTPDADPRTPGELLDLIEAKGREITEALAVLRSLTPTPFPQGEGSFDAQRLDHTR